MSDRPLPRRMIRLAARLALPRRAHWADPWPHLSLSPGEARWKGRPLVALHPIGELVPAGLPRIAIVGSGPSLGRQRPDRLPAGASILLNGAAQLAGEVRPLAVAVEDERFVYRRGAILDALPREVPLLLSVEALRACAERDPEGLARRPVALLRMLLKPGGGPKRAPDDPALASVVRRGYDTAFSLDPDAGVVGAGTVAYSALQVALAARPGALLLAGIDLSNDRELRFNEVAGDRAVSGLSRGLDRILAGFALARDVAAERGVDVACASPVSALLGIGYRRTAELDP